MIYEIRWIFLDPRMTPEDLGYLPQILLPFDEQPVAKQIAERYAHGGGYDPYNGFKIVNHEKMTIKHPGDAPLKPLAKLDFPLSREVIYLYESGWVLILQQDGSFTVTRMD